MTNNAKILPQAGVARKLSELMGAPVICDGLLKRWRQSLTPFNFGEIMRQRGEMAGLVRRVAQASEQFRLPSWMNEIGKSAISDVWSLDEFSRATEDRLEEVRGRMDRHLTSAEETRAAMVNCERLLREIAAKPSSADGSVLQEVHHLLKSYIESEEPAGGRKSPQGSDTLTNEMKGIAYLVKHPDWTVADIANAVGVSRTTPYTWGTLMTLWKLFQERASPRLGSKDAEGNVEAYA